MLKEFPVFGLILNGKIEELDDKSAEEHARPSFQNEGSERGYGPDCAACKKVVEWIGAYIREQNAYHQSKSS